MLRGRGIRPRVLGPHDAMAARASALKPSQPGSRCRSNLHPTILDVLPALAAFEGCRHTQPSPVRLAPVGAAKWLGGFRVMTSPASYEHVAARSSGRLVPLKRKSCPSAVNEPIGVAGRRAVRGPRQGPQGPETTPLPTRWRRRPHLSALSLARAR